MIIIKKLLVGLASISLIATTSVTVISCGTGPAYKVHYSNDNGVLKKLLDLDEDKIKEMNNAYELYNYIYEKIKPNSSEYNSLVLNKNLISKEVFEIKVLNGKNEEIKPEDKDFETKLKENDQRFYIIVNYHKSYGQIEDNKWVEKFQDEQENASFALINK